jgi:hypothetical protein
MAITYADKLQEHPDILGLWMLNEASGDVATDLVGTADGTHTGTPDVVGGLLVEGGNARDYGGAASGKRTSLPAQSSAVAIELWFLSNSGASSGYTQILGRYSANAARWGLFGTPTANLPVLNANGVTLIEPGTNYLGDGAPHHLVIQINAGKAEMWIDGVRELDDSTTNFTTVADAAVFDVGDSQYNSSYSGYNFDGAIDAIAFYSSPLSASDIADHYDWGVNGVPQPGGSSISGTVLLDGSPAAALMRLYLADTGELIEEIDSDEVTGDYTFGAGAVQLAAQPHYVMCIYGDGVRPLAHGPVTPVGAIIAPPTYFEAVDADSPSYWWRFDEEDGATVSSSGAEAVSDAALLGGASCGAEDLGTGGRSIAFDGGDDFINFGILNTDSYSTLTVEAVIKPDTLSGGRCIYKEGGSSNGFALGLLSDGFRFAINSSGGLHTVEFSTAGYSAGDVIHLAGVMDNTAGTLSLFVDGELKATTSGGVPSHNGACFAGIGGTRCETSAAYQSPLDGSTNAHNFSGRMSEVAVYKNVALSSERILAHANAIAR